MDVNESVTTWIGHLKAGDPAAAQYLWNSYFRPMVELARQKLHGASCRAADEEDVALSAFKSFVQGAEDGSFSQLLGRENLWPLLVALTAHKAVDLIRHENRLKRGGKRESDASLDELYSPEVSPDLAA